MTGKNTLIPIPAGKTGTSVQPDFGEAAAELYAAGWIPIPLRPGTKATAVKWEPWRSKLSSRSIRRYWAKHPDHELGVILGPDTIVFDADTPEGVIALYMLWESLDISPNLIVETARGEHHYFRRADGVFAKSDAPDKQDHQERVDIKTGKAIAAVPPSTGKRYALRDAMTIEDLMEATQDVVDAVYRHNGRDAPRKPPDTPPTSLNSTLPPGQLTAEVTQLLKHINPDSGYENWSRVGMALHTEYGGSDAGFDLFDSWSSKGAKYPGQQTLLSKWRTFDGYDGNPVRLGTLYMLAAQNGADLSDLAGETFDVVEVSDTAQEEPNPPEHGLIPYSLQGMSREFEAEMLDHRFILAGIAILGQWTVIYAAPNTGKTLIVLWLIIKAIKAGDIPAQNLFYVNADDNLQGLTAKLRLAEQHGFHMLAPGYKGFKVKKFLTLLHELCNSKQALGTVIILDTLKKFTDLMDKRSAADFSSQIREFIAKGGTMIALAHVNKKRGHDGKPIYAGTTDIVDDADCAFVLDTISDEGDVRTVEFENIKSRGMVVRRAAYGYSITEGQLYTDILASLTPVDDSAAEALRIATAEFDERDAALVETIVSAIHMGVTGKTQLIKEVMEQSGMPRRQVERVIDKFTGDDPCKHHWSFTRGARGLTTYELLPEPVATYEPDQQERPPAAIPDDLDDLDEEVY